MAIICLREFVRSQLSFGAGLGSRCWVDTEQPHPSSPDISHCAPALLGEGLLSSPLQVEQQLMPLPSVKTPALPTHTRSQEGHTAKAIRRSPASDLRRRFAPWFGTKSSLVFLVTCWVPNDYPESSGLFSAASASP